MNRYYKFFLTLLYASVLSISTFAQSNESLPAAAVTEVEKAITSYMSKHQVPGLSIAIRLKKAAFQDMISPLTLNGKSHPLGAGWAIGTAQWLPDREAREGVIWSGGNILGATSIIYMIPEHGYSVVILTNVQDKGTVLLMLADDLTDIVLSDISKGKKK
ncbi:MAG TPA: hypothetical protein VK892_13000 [Pyrinomonadaceae bacterium]|nr:hypothetical protein [Pyrinomonadaceae bacterium]